MEHVLVPCVAIVAAGFLLTWRLRRKAKVCVLPVVRRPMIRREIEEIKVVSGSE
jgi:hypothetical protein